MNRPDSTPAAPTRAACRPPLRAPARQPWRTPLPRPSAALLVGCASPEPRYYTLAQASGTGAAAAPQATPQGKPVWIEVAPVHVPERLNRAELVVGEDGSADGDSRLRRLELARWSAPLPDELRAMRCRSACRPRWTPRTLTGRACPASSRSTVSPPTWCAWMPRPAAAPAP